MQKTKTRYIEKTVPSTKGKPITIRREYQHVIDMLKAQIEYKEFVQSLVFAISLTESYIADTLLLNLIAMPKKLLISAKGNETVSLPVEMSDVLNYSSLSELVTYKAKQRVRDALYAMPKEYMRYLEKIMSFKLPDELMRQFSEIKATRDIYIHNEGIANEIYVVKAEGLARAKAGERLVVDAQYLNTSVSCMKDIFVAIGKGMVEKHGDNEEMQKALTEAD